MSESLANSSNLPFYRNSCEQLDCDRKGAWAGGEGVACEEEHHRAKRSRTQITPASGENAEEEEDLATRLRAAEQRIKELEAQVAIHERKYALAERATAVMLKRVEAETEARESERFAILAMDRVAEAVQFAMETEKLADAARLKANAFQDGRNRRASGGGEMVELSNREREALRIDESDSVDTVQPPNI